MNDSALIQQLSSDLQGDDRTKARYAAFRLSQIEDDRARRALLDALKHPDSEIRSMVAQTLGDKGDAGYISALILCLADRSRAVRRASVRSLALIGGMDALSALVGTLLADDNSYVRWEAAKALGTISAVDSVPALLEALSADANSYVRYAAAEAMGSIGDHSAIDGLEYAMLNDANDFVRYAAATALGQIGDASAAPALIVMLNYANAHVWHAAAEAIWAFDEEAMPYVLDALLDPTPGIRRAALKAVLWLSVEFDDADAADRQEDGWYSMWGWWN